MRLLGSILVLHDVRDGEGFCRTVLDRWLRTRGAFLRPDHYESALTHLIAAIWQLSARYDTTQSAISFSTYAGDLLPRRVVDWYRAEFGDSRYGRPQLPLSLDELRDRLDGSIAHEEADDTPDREQADVLTRAALSLSVVDELDADAVWRRYLTPSEAAA